MIRKVAKIVAWTAAGIAGFAALLYLAALAVNWRDREPSAVAERLTSQYRDRPLVADADNAYVYLLGFHAPRDRDPFEVGLSRVAWLRAAGDAPPNPDDDPLHDSFGAGNVPRLDELRTGCTGNQIDCVGMIDVSPAAFDDWMTSNGWWLERYRALLERPAWQEVVPVGSPAFFPTYGGVGAAQNVLLLQAGVLAGRGDAAQVKSLLAVDAHFWREVLRSSDVLVTKMIAVGALRRSFERGNLAIRKLPPASAADAVPDEWRSPFTDSELSLRRAIAGEWRYVDGMVRLTAPNGGAFGRLYQSQDTRNRRAEYYSGAGDALDAPLQGYSAAVDRARAMAEQLREEGHPPHSLYNLLGRVLLAESGPADFANYAARVADVEGVRRAALAATTLRIEGVQPADVPAALRATAPRNPYDGEPLLWDEARAAIVFRGLERGARREHRLYY